MAREFALLALQSGVQVNGLMVQMGMQPLAAWLTMQKARACGLFVLRDAVRGYQRVVYIKRSPR